ncbi:ABC transporter ATP-binding protein [Paenibacillus favisporus]|uniref:ABC transporter ATP-binding protein n=1 Tax=Paenibacillus favisporus TaxID=221028 RepID=UPI001980CD81|nr:ABC transporter ATP-binding protein [Paenibacillus favisporus]
MIEVKNVSMCFRMTTQKISSAKEYLIKLAKSQVKYNDFWALRNITFNIRKGEIFGILGYNGAGKSTLLKIISGVMKPTEGEVKIMGTMAPLIELGAGFDPELSARENIFLNGAVLGYSKKEMRLLFDEIVDFSELKTFIDVPVKNFSSGMYARLGFAVATAIKPDILIVDEILSVGDYKFRMKCEEKINEMIDDGTTILLVSHDIDQVTKMCSSGLLLENGGVVCCGSIESVASYYYKSDGNSVIHE